MFTEVPPDIRNEKNLPTCTPHHSPLKHYPGVLRATSLMAETLSNPVERR